MKRKNILVTNQVYHVFSRSIANFQVFNSSQDYERMLLMLHFYQIPEPPIRFSAFMRLEYVKKAGFFSVFKSIASGQNKVTEIIAYCLMPTHIHLILKQLQETGISLFMSNILNSYSRYFNSLHQRKGPLWESRFQNVLVDSDEQLLHLTRYLHLNPVTAYLVDKPENWKFSSYREFIEKTDSNLICQFNDVMEIKPKIYQKFVQEQTNYQRELAKIKNLLIE